MGTSSQNGDQHIEWSYRLDTHTCCQRPVDIKVHEFKAGLKSIIAKDYTIGYASAYETFKQKFLTEIIDEDLRENVRIHLPTKNSLRSACYRARALPKAPLNRSDIDLELLDICKDEYLIYRLQHKGGCLPFRNCETVNRIFQCKIQVRWWKLQDNTSFVLSNHDLYVSKYK